MFESYLGEIIPKQKPVEVYKGWEIFVNQSGNRTSGPIFSYFASKDGKTVVGGFSCNTLEAVKYEVDKSIGAALELTQKPTYENTGKTFSYRTSDGRGAVYNLWKRKNAESRTTKNDGVKTTVQLPMFFWSERDPNPGLMHTMDMKFSDSYKPTGGNSVEEAQVNAAAWAATKPGERQGVVVGPPAVIPTPEEQGENLAKLIEQMQQQGRPAPGYDPVAASYTPPAQKSKLPLILGGVVLVAVGAALWWRFRK
jgi:hypothetical protein